MTFAARFSVYSDTLIAVLRQVRIGYREEDGRVTLTLPPSLRYKTISPAHSL